jgi:hypothetical protein
MAENVRSEWKTPVDRMGATLNVTESCRACDAPLAMTRTPKRTTQPLNPEPVEDGNIVVRDGIALSEKQAEGFWPGEPRYKTHFATCPAADTFRRKRKPA